MKKSLILFLLLLIWVVYAAVLMAVRRLYDATGKKRDRERNINHSGETESKINTPLQLLQLGTQSQATKRDCDIEMIYSMLDSQCEVICQGPLSYRSKNGVCVNMRHLSNKLSSKKCDPTRGNVEILIGDGQFGTIRTACYSLDPGIQSDGPGDAPNFLCKGGDVDIDYTLKFPTIADCKCGKDEVKILIPNTSVIRHRAVCVNRIFHDFYKKAGMLFDDSKIYH